MRLSVEPKRTANEGRFRGRGSRVNGRKAVAVQTANRIRSERNGRSNPNRESAGATGGRTETGPNPGPAFRFGGHAHYLLRGQSGPTQATAPGMQIGRAH